MIIIFQFVDEIINQLHQINNLQFNFKNQEYQINISACNSNGKCGYFINFNKTDNLTSPIIYETISKIEEIEFNFTKLNKCK
ncbi:hypothetical protein M0811_14756 [Anaeramoeba ignava]|uniref:Uncharacterized protein n=1 Tax=Anaeramoeba ignava TaxID=1746090 RepID=A0A9Q0RFC7_ANAIG|nr:hypothetical protein M0811_14756 [Anaeramoeba ignava]